MLAIHDAIDAILAGMFLFGLLLTLVSLLLGAADLGVHVHHGGSDGEGLPFSLVALLVALTWLGGVGFLLRRAAGWPAILALLVAAGAAVAAGALVQRSLRALSRHAGVPMNPEEYRLPGVIGRVTSSIRPGGTGEVVYEQGGVRHVVAARAANADGLPRGTEVVVLRVDRGVAIVEIFDPFEALDRSTASREPAPGRPDASSSQGDSDGAGPARR